MESLGEDGGIVLVGRLAGQVAEETAPDVDIVGFQAEFPEDLRSALRDGPINVQAAALGGPVQVDARQTDVLECPDAGDGLRQFGSIEAEGI